MNQVPAGYKHFDVDKHKRELLRYLISLEVDNVKIFNKNELLQIRQRRFLIEDRIRKHKINNRDLQDYVNYVFNFGLTENAKPNFAKMSYGGRFC